jgi:hypothetical protein
MVRQIRTGNSTDSLKLVTANLRQVRRRPAEVEERGREPIAIVGMGCRFPGGAADQDRLLATLVRTEAATVLDHFPRTRSAPGARDEGKRGAAVRESFSRKGPHIGRSAFSRCVSRAP